MEMRKFKVFEEERCIWKTWLFAKLAVNNRWNVEADGAMIVELWEMYMIVRFEASKDDDAQLIVYQLTQPVNQASVC